jgi:hypothetical protein
MARQPTVDEKKVFGHDCTIDPKTNRPIEKGHGAPGHITGPHLIAAKRSLLIEMKEAAGLGLTEIADDLKAKAVEADRAIRNFNPEEGQQF